MGFRDQNPPEPARAVHIPPTPGVRCSPTLPNLSDSLRIGSESRFPTHPRSPGRSPVRFRGLASNRETPSRSDPVRPLWTLGSCSRTLGDSCDFVHADWMLTERKSVPFRTPSCKLGWIGVLWIHENASKFTKPLKLAKNTNKYRRQLGRSTPFAVTKDIWGRILLLNRLRTLLPTVGGDGRSQRTEVRVRAPEIQFWPTHQNSSKK